MKTLILVCILFGVTSGCSHTPEKPDNQLGLFQVDQDLFLAHFDSKTDVDDIHAIAGVATMLADPRFKNVEYHAVAGAYGIQQGLYVPAPTLFNLAFGNNWSDAHNNYAQALSTVTHMASAALERGGNLWIAEAGQSDFSAEVVRNLRSRYPHLNTRERIHIVQHSTWNEEHTAPAQLLYVKAHTHYQKIPDGNATGNGSPGFKSEGAQPWQHSIRNTELKALWQLATNIANQYNGQEGRYNNDTIAKGGMDFSDVAETCWIFGFSTLENAESFFTEFNP